MSTDLLTHIETLRDGVASTRRDMLRAIERDPRFAPFLKRMNDAARHLSDQDRIIEEFADLEPGELYWVYVLACSEGQSLVYEWVTKKIAERN